MHKKHKVRRSVAIQSTDDAEIEIGPQMPRLCKKTGFKNLLQQSVTIIPQGNEEENEGLVSIADRNSKSVQASFDGNQSFQRFQNNVQSLEMASVRYSARREDDPEVISLQSMRTAEQVRTGNPGTSKMASVLFGSEFSQVNDVPEEPREGSLAVVYSYNGKPSEYSKSSNFAFFYGSQGSRRFSNETVILTEDYQSYDFTNVVRRLDLDLNERRRRNIFCCNKNKDISDETLTRPINIPYEEPEEKEEAAVCRICHEGEDIEPLIQPCLCKGSVGNVHPHCLKIWLEQSNTSRCELCSYPYAVRQTKKYPKCLSVKVFFRTVVDRRALAYDIVSFVIITPLTLLGVAMCIQASIYSGSGDAIGGTNYQMGNITKAGMIMLSGTIIVAYGVWLYTLISYHFKSWKRWYNNCYDVEVLPVRLTSEERQEAAQRLSDEMNRRQLSREQGSAMFSILHSPTPPSFNFYHRRFSESFTSHEIQANR